MSDLFHHSLSFLQPSVCQNQISIYSLPIFSPPEEYSLPFQELLLQHLPKSHASHTLSKIYMQELQFEKTSQMFVVFRISLASNSTIDQSSIPLAFKAILLSIALFFLRLNIMIIFIYRTLRYFRYYCFHTLLYQE